MSSNASFFPDRKTQGTPGAGAATVIQHGDKGAHITNQSGNQKSFNSNSFNTTIHNYFGGTSPTVPLETSNADYSQYLKTTCDRVWGPRGESGAQKAIRNVYARLFVTEPSPLRTPDDDTAGDGKGNKDGDRRTGVLSVVSEHRCVAILGTPGGGKSTFLRHLAVFRSVCHDAGESGGQDGVEAELQGLDASEAEAWRTLNAYVPVFIELGSLKLPSPGEGEGLRHGLPWILHAHLEALKHGDGVMPVGTPKEQQDQRTAAIQRLLIEAFFGGRVLFLLDGLDEVTTVGSEGRAVLHRGLRQLVNWTPPGGMVDAPNRVVLTCREWTWFQGWEITKWKEDLGGHLVTLQGFSKDDRLAFLTAWFQRSPDKAGDVARHLEDPMRDVGGRLSRMASVPLNLTMIAWLVEQRADDVPLPPNRAAIYEQVVHAILWEIDSRKVLGPQGKKTLPQLVGSADTARMDFVCTLAGLAFDKLGRQDEPVWTGAELLGPISSCLARAGGEPERAGDYRSAAQDVLNTMQCRSGILRRDTDGSIDESTYRFVHRSFLEYFVALHLVRPSQGLGMGFARKARDFMQGRSAIRSKDAKGSNPTQLRERTWEPLRLAAGHHAVPVTQQCALVSSTGVREKDRLWEFVEGLYSGSSAVAYDTWLAGELAVEAQLKPSEVPDSLRQALFQVMQSGDTLSEPERAQVGRILGSLGDPRPGVAPVVGPDQNARFFAWSRRIKRGTEFTMGGDKYAFQGEGTVKAKIEADYHVAVYPVTNAQYDAFESSPEFRRAGWERRRRGGAGFDGPNQPVVGVTWEGARRFCEWINSMGLSGRQLGIKDAREGEGWEVRLAEEWEWEYAARGAEGRWLPWMERAGKGGVAPKAEGSLLKGRCNWNGSGIGSPSAVGMYPEGRSWCGAEDMIGNVWEWTATPRRTSPGEEDTQVPRVLRGGSWGSGVPESLRCAARGDGGPGNSVDLVGFRVVCVRVSASGG